ncbi:hypothetical protein [Nocardia sp. NPDC052566]|uniref:hypothetical protein n=1 Tax=Nocardia sp. NPDC052566 TaxID=3364330 RepID=UPI0037C6553E
MRTEMTFAIPDSLVGPLKRHAGTSHQSEFVARAIRHELLRADVDALNAAEAATGVPDIWFETACQNDQETGS